MGNFKIALIALAITCVSVAITASALNGLTISQSETEPQGYNLTHGSAKVGRNPPSYGIVHVTMPKGKKAFPAELVPVD